MAAPLTLQQAQARNSVATLVPDASRARVEIEELLGDNDVTNLYLLALEEMQKEDVTKSVAKGNEDWWTFYSISGEQTRSGVTTIHINGISDSVAGIHGLPEEKWDGVRNELKPNGNGSYCTHGSIVFPTWHRVYINMFEVLKPSLFREVCF